MLVMDADRDRLEQMLDGALGAAEAGELRDRLSREADLSAALTALRRERELRRTMWAGIEPTDQDVLRLVARVTGATKRRMAMGRSWRVGAAVAACVAISFFAGWKLRGNKPAEVVQVRATSEISAPYQVALTDENGHVTAVQNFDSLAKAKEFAGDLGQWQQRQQQMRDGAAVVVADRF